MAYDLTAVLRLNDQMSSQMRRASGQISNASTQTSKLSNGLKAAAGFAAGLGVTIGAAGLVKAVVGIGVAFDDSMAKVQAVSGATGDELMQLRDLAKEMGATTKFSASESADALNYMAMAGWKTEQMIDGLPGILNLAAASGTDLATTSDIVTDALTGFGLQAADSGKFADVLAAASSNANTDVQMLGESFKYVAPLAGAMKYSAEDVSVALGLMANAGIKGLNIVARLLRNLQQKLSVEFGEIYIHIIILWIITVLTSTVCYN